MSQPDLPPGVGPHEGREFDLMRAGKKHVALFTDWEPEGLNAILLDGFIMLKTIEHAGDGKTFDRHIVFRPGYEAQALRLFDIVKNPRRGWIDAQEHEIGRILGYTKEEVEAFLTHVRRGEN